MYPKIPHARMPQSAWLHDDGTLHAHARVRKKKGNVPLGLAAHFTRSQKFFFIYVLGLVLVLGLVTSHMCLRRGRVDRERGVIYFWNLEIWGDLGILIE